MEKVRHIAQDCHEMSTVHPAIIRWKNIILHHVFTD
jgi:hypothetical protein